MPAVSLIIPVYNSEEFLEGCLDSVVGQTFRDTEIICVDDGSTDSSPQILTEFAQRDDRVRVITQENGGQAVARERGLSLATGEFVMFLDNDDHFEPTMVEEAHALSTAENTDITVFKIRYFDATTGDATVPDWVLRMDLVPETRPFNRKDMPSSFFVAFTPALWNKLFRRSFLVANDIHFRPGLRFSDDLAFTYTALALAERISVIDKALVNYRTKREGSLWTKLSEHPTDVLFALREARERITAGDVFDDVEPAFANAALSQCLYNLSTVRTYESFTLLYGELQSGAFSEFGVLDHPEADYLRPEDHRRLVRIMESSPEQYLFDEVRMSSETIARQRDRIRRLSARGAKTDEKLSAIQEGEAYRLARAITAIPRKIGRSGRGAKD